MSHSARLSLMSSPDPLNDSPTFSSPVKSQATRTRKSFPLQGSSPRKQTFQLHVGDNLSPQKIRVTVEAEHPEHSINNERPFTVARNIPSPTPYHIPRVRQSVRTTTTTIPVKGLSDSEDDSIDSAEKPTRGRGRPRKSMGTPVPTKSLTRSLTPKANQSPRRRRTFGDLIDGDDSEDWDFAIGAGVELSRGKGRSRSRSAKGAARTKSTPAAKCTSSPDKTASSVASRKGRGRRKTLTPEEIIIHEDYVDINPGYLVRDIEKGFSVNGALAHRDVNLVPTISATLTDQKIIAIEENVESIKSPTVPTKSLLQPVTTPEVKNNKDHEHSEDDERLADEVQEFDTVLESEGFSMISVDSVPSLREHLSSPAGPSQSSREGQATAGIGDAVVLNSNGDEHHEDSFSSIASEILEAATPRRKPSNSMLRAVLSSKNPVDEDSFSSIPQEILEAATPGKHGLRSRLLSVKVQESKPYDDSFSSIPPAILEAVNPAKFASTEATRSKLQTIANSQSQPVPMLAIKPSFLALEKGKESMTSSGLLTPNDTPSPSDADLQFSLQADDCESKPLTEHGTETCNILLQEESYVANSQIRSSPPFVSRCQSTYAADSQQSELHVKHIETPSIMYSSPMLPPLIQQSSFDRSRISSKLDINDVPKQSLSPTVRAGRVLQDIATTSSSRSRTQSLGSPFKSPAAQRKPVENSNDSSISSGTGRDYRKPEEKKGEFGDLFVGFSENTQRELRRSMISGAEFARNQKNSDIVNSVSYAHREDPFSNVGQHSYSSSHKEGQQYILELPNQPSSKTKLRTGVMVEDQQFQDSLRSESAMSWQAENAVALPTSGYNICNSEKQPVNVGDDYEHMEEDVWQVDVHHSSSISEEQSQSIPPQQDHSERPRRSKIPSPWRKNSNRLVYSDELAQDSSPHQIDKFPSNPQAKSQTKATLNPVPKRTLHHSTTEDEEDFPDSSVVWHIPQKLNFAPRPRSTGNLDLSALLASSPLKIPQRTSNLYSQPDSPISETAQTNDLKSTDLEEGTSRSRSNVEESLQGYVEEKPEQEGDTFQDDSNVDSTSGSDEQSELVSESAQGGPPVCYPTLPNTTSLSPQKSCLRTPASNSPTKSVAFALPTQAASSLSATTWSKPHWQLLHSMHNNSKLMHLSSLELDPQSGSESSHEKSENEVVTSKYLGKTIIARGEKLTLEQWHLDIVREFREEVPGWDEGVIAKRLFAIIVGERLRMEGKA